MLVYLQDNEILGLLAVNTSKEIIRYFEGLEITRTSQ